MYRYAEVVFSAGILKHRVTEVSVSTRNLLLASQELSGFVAERSGLEAKRLELRNHNDELKAVRGACIQCKAARHRKSL